MRFNPPPAANPREGFNTFRYAVRPGFFETMGIPLRSGRLFDEHDRAGAPLVALISESLARARFGGADPLGARLQVGPPSAPVYTIIGVVGDVRQQSPALGDASAVYVTRSQWWFADNARSLVLRAGGDPSRLTHSIRQAI